MYIQSPREDAIPLPRDYSGNTFRQAAPLAETSEESPPTAPLSLSAQEEQASPLLQDAKSEQATPNDVPDEATAPTGAFFKEERDMPRAGIGGLFSGASSLLSSLLPPARGSKKRRDGWSEWVVIGIALLLFLNDDANDLLPLLLLLLLWD